jgi:selenocysteine lyase/cysteine desulfurase
MRTLSGPAIACLDAWGYRVITPAETCGPIVTFATGRTEEETDALVADLGQENIVVVKHLDPAGEPYIRLSFHAYNTVDEIERFGRVLTKL